MISFATLVMIGWIPIILVSFSLLTPRRAVITAYIVGWLFLPILKWDLPGLPQYDKATATSLGVLVAVLLFDPQRLARFRPGLVDLPLLVFCLCPIGTSLANGFGLYDGLAGIAGVWSQLITWAVPWVIGRCYFESLSALRDLAIGMFLGAVVYVPLCFFEMAFGAILHLKVYGYYQHSPDQTIRTDGSIRPMVFMQHGLMLAMWMGSSALAGIAVSRADGITFLPRSIKTGLALILIATTLLSRSVGASALLVVGLVVWSAVRVLRIAFPLVLIAVAVPSYMILRVSGSMDVADMTGVVSTGLVAVGFSPAEAAQRLESARVRFESEDQLLEQARAHPVFGAGSWNFNHYLDPVTGEGRMITTDGDWIIQFATRGITGLGSWTALLLLPVLLFVRRHPPGSWSHPLVATGGALSLVLLLYTIDCLMNAHINPIYALIAGGLAGLPALARRGAPARPAVLRGV